MDDYMFKTHVATCKSVFENTSYLEILNYSDRSYDTIEEHPLSLDEFDNFLRRRGAFEPPRLKEGVRLVHGVRLVLQLKAKHPETFTPSYMSLTAEAYESMVRILRLPFRAIESASVVGPFFWSALDQDDEDPHLQMVARKSDVRKKGLTRGWELMVSHSFKTAMTSGYAKGTASSDLVECVEHLKACAEQAMHPMLLPVIVLSYDLSAKNDQKQREARDWLRHLEHAISMRDDVNESDASLYVKGQQMDLDQIYRDLVECHSRVLWKRPQAYQDIIETHFKALDRFWEKAGEDAKYGGKSGDVYKVHRSMISRLEFCQMKLKGIENYAHTTLERLHIQRSALYNVIAQKEAKLNLDFALQQRRMAHASKRDSDSMKTLSLLGAVFLPATYLASLFSMTFFNFQNSDGGNNASSSNNNSPVVSPQIWIYFVITAPVTLFIVVAWRVWDNRRERRYKVEDAELESGIDKMEQQIIAKMRKRTMSKKKTTWELSNIAT